MIKAVLILLLILSCYLVMQLHGVTTTTITTSIPSVTEFLEVCLVGLLIILIGSMVRLFVLDFLCGGH